jgi:hypothetical protein
MTTGKRKKFSEEVEEFKVQKSKVETFEKNRKAESFETFRMRWAGHKEWRGQQIWLARLPG